MDEDLMANNIPTGSLQTTRLRVTASTADYSPTIRMSACIKTRMLVPMGP